MLSKRDVLGGIVGSTALAIAGPAFARGKLLGKASFRGVGPKSVSGSAAISLDGETLRVQLSKDFKSDDGPDLFIILHEPGVEKGVQKGKFVNLGRLPKGDDAKGFNIGFPYGRSGLKDYDSVVVWCREFNVTFGIGKIIMIGE